MLPRLSSAKDPSATVVVDNVDRQLALADVVVVERGAPAEAAAVVDQLLDGGLDLFARRAAARVLHKGTDGVPLRVVVVAAGAADLLAVVVLPVVGNVLASALHFFQVGLRVAEGALAAALAVDALAGGGGDQG